MRFIKWIGVLCALCFTISVAAEESRFLDNTRQLTYSGKRAGEGYFSEDGTAIIFQSEREPDNPFYQIYLMNLKSGDTHRVSTGVGKTTCAFFRPGTDEVLYASTHHDIFASAKQEEELEFRASGKERRYSWDYDEAMDIFSAKRDGGNLKQLTDAPGYDAEASYSPDGTRIVFCSLRDAYPKSGLSPQELKQLEVDPAYFGEIYIMNADGSNQQRLTDKPGYDGGPFFTPDGQHIVWRHFTPDGSKSDIYTMRTDGSRVRRLTDFDSMSWAPYFHPSGAYVIFASNKLGFSNFELFLVDAAGRHEPIRVTHTDGFDGLPVFSPDGNTLCWTSNRNSQDVSQLYLAAWNHQAALTALAAAPESAHTSVPDDELAPANRTQTNLRNHIEFLADDALEGRMTGSDGAKQAADYIAEQFKQLGLIPVGESSGSEAWRGTGPRPTVKGKQPSDVARGPVPRDLSVLEEPAESDVARRGTGPRPTVKGKQPSDVARGPVPRDLSVLEEPAESDVARRGTGPRPTVKGKRPSDVARGPVPRDLSVLEEPSASDVARRGTGPRPTVLGESSDASGEPSVYFQEFQFTAGRKLIPNENRFWLTRPTEAGQDAGQSAHAGHTQKADETLEFGVETDFMPLSFSRNGVVEGEVVFVGYGLTVPGEMGVGYDAYAGIDVTDKIVVALRYVPEEVEPERRQELNRYAGLRYKAMQARERGAKAFLVVAGPNSPNAGKLIPLDFDNSLAHSGIIAASISDTVANALFATAGKQLKEVQAGLDVENPHFIGQFPLPDVTIKITVSVEKVKKTGRNVIALLPPVGSVSEPALSQLPVGETSGLDAAGSHRDTEYIVIGAHYDGLGYGEIGSLARKGEEGQIHNGADDNASGTAVVLELAARLSKTRETRARGILFALWSGEEIGIIGSSYFAENPVVPLDRIAAYLNFDMVGRLKENTLILQGVGSSSAWPALIERQNVPIGFNLTLQADPYLPTDVTAFYPKKVPVLNFFTGAHEDYHRPTDDVEHLNYEGMERVVALVNGMILDIASAAERPEYVEVERSQSGGGSRDTLRAYLGTIPDYSTDTAGVKLSGVRAGGPADKAGLKSGDVIIKFGGQQIANIYDYTYALDAVKIGEPVEVVVLRDGAQVTLTVIPEARN